MKDIGIRQVRISDSFWSSRQELITDVTIPYMEKILRDEIKDAEKSHAITNFRIAAGLEEGEFYGMVFQDSDVYKWLEAASYSLYLKPDAGLEERFDETVRLVGLAQQEDGYINTWFTVKQPGKRWTDLLECHELYCAGHLFEAAAACVEATGKTELLDISEKFADHIIDRFMDSDAIPGHEEVEIGLLRLFHVTGKKKYLDMAVRFLESRGKDPNWFMDNTPVNDEVAAIGCHIDPLNTEYNQSDMPIRSQTTSRGHAVRMMYLMTAMADAAAVLKDSDLLEVCRRVFDNTVSRKMAVTGGLGARRTGESFGEDWELPNDSCYNETCASIGMIFFTDRMLRSSADSRFADILELELYNGALAGMQLDGKRFFYVNPLEADPERSGIAPELQHVLIERPKWYGCACCPPNLARTIASLGKYIYGEDDDSVYVHLHVGSRAELGHATVIMESGLPWNGNGQITFEKADPAPFSMAVRVPGYASDFRIQVNGEQADYTLEKGYACLTGNWCKGDVIEFSFDISPRKIYPDEHVVNNRGCVACGYGPLVYCAEVVDNTTELKTVEVDRKAEIKMLPFDEDMLSGVIPLDTDGIRLIPYYAWGNRGKCAMKVWLKYKN